MSLLRVVVGAEEINRKPVFLKAKVVGWRQKRMSFPEEVENDGNLPIIQARCARPLKFMFPWTWPHVVTSTNAEDAEADKSWVERPESYRESNILGISPL